MNEPSGGPAVAGARDLDLVIFDCDGVLVDSETIANRALVGAVEELGLPLDEAGSRRRFVGLSMASIVKLLEAELGRSLPPGWLAELQAATYAGFRRELRPVPGVAAAIERVKAAGLAVCVASSGTPDKMALTLGLTGLDRYFDGHVFSASEVEHGKPAPDLFLHAAAGMGVAPPRCVVVEDSVPGVRAGVAAGMKVFGFARETPAERLAQAGARQVFADMADLPSLLALC